MSATPLNKQDINVFSAMDIKSYQYPLDIGEYKEIVKKGTAMSTIAALNGNKVGFAVWERGARNNPAYIARLGVLPRYRLQGIGRKILSWICEDIRGNKKIDKNDRLRIVLSQITCMGKDDPDDVSGFMRKVGFKWVDIIENTFFHYGRNENGFVFERQL